MTIFDDINDMMMIYDDVCLRIKEVNNITV